MNNGFNINSNIREAQRNLNNLKNKNNLNNVTYNSSRTQKFKTLIAELLRRGTSASDIKEGLKGVAKEHVRKHLQKMLFPHRFYNNRLRSKNGITRMNHY